VVSVPVDLTGVWVVAVSLLLALAGAAKLRRPEAPAAVLRIVGMPAPLRAARAVAAGELLIALAGLSLPGRIGAAVVAATYAGLAAAGAVGSQHAPGAGCGCFGDARDAPLGRRHVITNLALAGAAGGAAVVAPPALSALVVQRPALGGALLAGALALALVLRAWLRGTAGGLDASARRLVDASAFALESRVSRRSALMRMAVAGSALTIAPLRYLLYPGTAMAVVVPGDCADGLCTDGYTAFCCEINHGLNTCPADTFIGGWWMCTDYRGHQLCEGAGVRYYIDCNALPGRPFPGGCRCAEGTCDRRRVACNIFRYGQCNTQVAGTTAVVCRVVSCANPGHDPTLNCSTAVMIDDAVCGHEAGCLEPPPVQLPGVGGA
jgi:hypothetical protein